MRTNFLYGFQVKKPPRKKPKAKRAAMMPPAAKRPPRLAGAGSARTPPHAHVETDLIAAFYEGITGTPPKREPHRRGTIARSLYSSDEAATLLLLSLPILALMTSLGLTLAAKPHRPTELAMHPAPAGLVPVTAASPPLARSAPQLTRSAQLPALAPAPQATALPYQAPALAAPAVPAQPPQVALAPTATTPDFHVVQPDGEPQLLPDAIPPSPTILAVEPKVAMLAQPAPSGPVVASRDDIALAPSVCEAPANLFSTSRQQQTLAPQTASLTPAAFGAALARAAREQTRDLVIYNDRYRAIAYPMGDVQPLYGVCTDVVIRAYRAVGIDLQERVHEARTGGGDTSIDHRRTETLRHFFARFGRAMVPTSIAEDYAPGDIVTYNRPQNRHSRSHIAVVSDVAAPSGRYMIIHNRGWGPQLEDGLFVDEITGHYRYDGSERAIGGALAASLNKPPVSQAPTAVRLALPGHILAERTQTCRPGLKGLARSSCAKRETLAVRQDGKPVKGLGR